MTEGKQFKKSNSIVVAIHQPNFFPWLGYFHKIAHADKFIILDHVLNKPRDGIYPKRVTIVCNSQPYWLSVPLVQPRETLFIPINQMQISIRENVGPKHLKTIELSYKKTPFFEEFFPLFQEFYKHPSHNIADRNIEFIKSICELLAIGTKICLSSELGISTASNQMLVDLVKVVGGDTYVHGSFAVSEKGYQDNELFFQNDIQLQPQNFRHPLYKQYNNKGEFIVGASIMDALMNIGPDETKKLILHT